MNWMQSMLMASGSQEPWLALASWLSALAWLVATWFLWRASRRILSLADAPDTPESAKAGEPLPGVSVIVALRNEAESIERTIRSLLAQQLPSLEVIAVDDRSEDGSGEILERLAASDSRLKVVRVKTLPSHWLGKNHACHLGAGQARQEMLLFTDGDILFEPDALRRALLLMERHGLGHLTVAPELIAPGFLQRAFDSTFGIFFVLRFRIWNLHRQGSPGYAGIGAFNLVRRDSYLAMGGHRILSMEVVDDVKLGLILRRSGVPQAIAVSDGRVSLRWHGGFLDGLRGLQKNLFAGLEWRWSMLLASLGGMGLITLAPWVALALTDLWATRLAAGVALLLPMLLLGIAARRSAGGNGLEGLAYPAAVGALMAATLTSALTATWRGGIVWRETRYDLRELRAACVREKDWPRAKAVGWE